MYSINNTSNCCDGKAARPAQQHNQALPLRNVTSVESMRQGNKRGRCETSMGSSSEDDRSLGELHFSKSAKVLFDAESGSEDDISEESESEPDCDLDVLVGRQQRIASFKKPDMSVSEKYLTLLLSMVEPGVSMIHSQQASRLQSLVEYDDIGDNTKKLYITYLRLFKKYCDQIDYGKEECSRYNVTLDKTIGFFRKVMFKRRIKKLLRVSGYKDTAITIWLPTNNKRQEVVLDLNEIPLFLYMTL
ncbi:hypothetical protein BCR41DRAFT_347831 [Lobosporangium transversale]|uniref:Uncharacterized protein n=1 Tax=Lobosporangium transversale TaxID=64571 RepID=A0A1Y2GZ34_9FUNG|nr:hypothetical protein BCR41DRAFT_347831 [Lobosporangium transversale]ORZ26733.1 hypothetical protein BCR41DRAFT_347831 [Lobosporangium transversale]|eukprot:XP_021884496.1 hypothetical protein BCR41DRAFT_347831 [Lobosporangium transversale]